jgi:signal transduction histidine kinase
MSETTVAREATGWRRFRPRGIRTRLTILYTSLFLAAGAVLLALTFALVSNSLGSPPGSAIQQPSAALLHQCKEQATAHATGKKVPIPVNLACRKAFTAGELSATADQRSHTKHELEVWSLVGLALITAASAGVGWVMAGRALRPVHEITAAARRASERHLGERIALTGPEDELKELADTFDAMLDRLDLAFAAQRQFVANASHELRTPLTSMRTAIDVVLAKPTRTNEQLEATAEKVRRAIDRAEDIIDALLTLTVSSRKVEDGESLDLATVTEDALDAVSEQARGAGVRLSSELLPAPVAGSRVLLERLVGNLVENAVVHNVPDGWVRVRAGATDGHAYLEVANSGPVIPDDLVPHLFEPFRRADSRTGTAGVGLGLSIVQSVATAHAAEVIARPQEGGGLVVTLTVPSHEGPPPESPRRQDLRP